MTENEIIIAIATKNNCYKRAKKLIPKGIVVHSTGANNPRLSRYVDAPAAVGNNTYGNHWNQPTPDSRQVCVHAFIGLDIKNQVRVAQILPYEIAPWGCGVGVKGSYNSSHIQFEICEDTLNDKAYFEQAFSQAIEYCAYLCNKFNLPVSSIVSHAEAHKKGYASNHGDCDHWLKKFGLDMNWFRKSVQEVINKLYSPSSNTVNANGSASTESLANGSASSESLADGSASTESLASTESTDYATLVCEKCGFTVETRNYIDNHPYAADLWRKLWERMK